MNSETIEQIHNDHLSSKKNVNGVGIGMKWVNGQPTDQQAVLIFVQKKYTKRGLINKYSEEEMIPSSFDGIPTDVIEVGYIKKQDFKGMIRPIKPGYSCGQKDITSGTIGGVFIDSDGDPVILSNNHVLANENKANIGDIILQPGPSDGPKNVQFKGWDSPASSLPYFSTLKKFVPLTANGNVQDSAIAKIHSKFVQGGMIDPIYPIVNKALSGFGTPSVNMQVQKFGRTTGFTTGRIIGIKASFTVGYDIGECRFNDCIVCTSMSKGGDSGSIILDMNMQAVGLLFAGSPKVTLATPFQTVSKQYGLSLWNTKPVPSMELDDGQWTIFKSYGTITRGIDSIKMVGPANCYCFIQRILSTFQEIKVKVNTGTDKGATWGPGISIVWPNGILKVNLRYSGSFAGVYNGNANLNIGNVQPNKDYILRMRKTAVSYVGEVNDGNKWHTVIEVPVSIFPSNPLYLVVGKTNEIGYVGDNNVMGDTGECTFSDLDVK